MASLHPPSADRDAGSAGPWWRDAVIYQVYPRSFLDTDGDGIGDLRGVIDGLDHIARLGTDAVWLSPFYPSPLADFGYDVSDHTTVDPAFGTLADVDRLISEAHGHGLHVIVDLIASHTSIEHPWFHDHPDWYVWSDRDGPQNNWRASFGGPAWSRDPGGRGWYLHSFYPEQPDLDWRRGEVREAVAGVIRFWLERGVDGFRVDAVDRLVKDPELRDDPPARRPPPLPLHPEHASLEHRHSRAADRVEEPLAALREAAGGALLLGEIYLPTSRLAPYLDHLDLAFSFELLHSTWAAEALAAAIGPAAELGGIAWALSNHDFPRAASRAGSGAERLAAMLLLTLPGAACIYQGDEIGMRDGPGASPPRDRHGRDPFRHPMQWSPAPGGGFTSGDPWLPIVDPERVSVAAQSGDPGSLLELHRRLIGLRRELRGGLELIGSEPEVLAFRRGAHAVALNLGTTAAAIPVAGETLISTAAGGDRGRLGPREGRVVRAIGA